MKNGDVIEPESSLAKSLHGYWRDLYLEIYVHNNIPDIHVDESLAKRRVEFIDEMFTRYTGAWIFANIEDDMNYIRIQDIDKLIIWRMGHE